MQKFVSEGALVWYISSSAASRIDVLLICYTGLVYLSKKII
ncbi:hypothetical protein HanXRQr2_Chr12g0534611 [Helianthus annuus]|uniref:Uncharacterized protein n=1 Tax=Helianthus annuus TaxID=4232 RepID=A0A9K3MVJ2_HELAN|nr:hypothetical protein HanXRQr2_Chr12g0534611 [Helianthus annuus]